MQVHRDLNRLPEFERAVVTIGTFDGVHTGHLQIIRQMKEEARRIGGESVIITFHPHPRSVIYQKNPGINHQPLQLLNTLDEKIMLLEQQEIDHLVVVTFTKDFSEQPADSYVEHFLISRFKPAVIIIGYDHRFGKNRSGDYKLLESYQSKFAFEVKEIPEKVLDDVAISSTRIRRALLEGRISEANEALGYHYFFSGIVVEGNKLGRALGYPTANLEIEDPDKLVPLNGIYAVEVELLKGGNVQKIQSPGMMSIGVRPTIGLSDRTIEVNIFDFDQDIYGRHLRVSLHDYMRPEIKFEDLTSLTDQIRLDELNAKKLLGIG